MKKIIYYIAGIIGFTILTTGCEDSFLDKKPIAKEIETDFYADLDALDMTLVATYSRFCLNACDFLNILYPGVISDDVEGGGETDADGANIKIYDKLQHDASTAENGDLLRLWANPYKGIRLANSFIEYLPTVRTAENTEAANRKEGEALFLRAFFNFDLLQKWGGIPINDHVLSPSEFTKARNSVAEVLHAIQADLEQAIPHLPKRSQQDPRELGRATQGAAQSLLAKAYLFESSYAKYHAGDERFAGCENKFSKALEVAQQVINSKEYQLLGVNGERYTSWWGNQPGERGDGKTNGYRYLWSVAGNNSSEGVFEVQNAMDGKGYYQTRGNAICVYVSCRFFLNENNQRSAVGFWGFNVASKYLLDAFANQDRRVDYAQLAPENKETLSLFRGPNCDPRLHTTCGFQGDPIFVRDGSTDAWRTIDVSNIPAENACRKYETAPSEFWYSTEPAKAANESGPINWRLIRYSEVLLIAAEAAVEAGQVSVALPYINEVRTRARNCGVDGQVYPKNLTSCSLADIMQERRIELALEGGHRYYDLVRWNKGYDYINGISLAMSPDQKLVYQKGKHDFFPIPMTQVQLSDGNLEQYPGW